MIYSNLTYRLGASLLSRGAWIEIASQSFAASSSLSLLSRGAWIEIKFVRSIPFLPKSRSSHEERGLKYHNKLFQRPERLCRSSHEERGLKCITAWRQTAEFMSLLSRGAWIEIQINSQFGFMHHGRSSHEERGLKSPLLWLNLP